MPIVLPPHQPADRFYRGGERIRSFRGGTSIEAPAIPSIRHEPEDWLASTTTLHGAPHLGLTILPGGGTLRDAVAESPEYWLGAEHRARFGADTKLLTKLLDAGQRLPVHAHPSRSFAEANLGRAHGKAEAWFILTPGTVHLGVRESLTSTELAQLVDLQDTAGLLSALHARDVRAGDVVYVPPGMLHAIGEAVLLIEVQEPEDLSILLEWAGFDLDGRRDGHLGLGFHRALGAVDRGAVHPSRLAELIRAAPAAGSVLPPEADEFFRLERIPVSGETTLNAGFAVAVVTHGSVRIATSTATGVREQHAHPAGSVLLLAHGEGLLEVSGEGELVVCRPPL